jgi:hypothetical protein
LRFVCETDYVPELRHVTPGDLFPCFGNRNRCLIIWYHVVFGLPHRLVPMVWQNSQTLFAPLLEASAVALLEVAANPGHLGAKVGFRVSCIPGDRISSLIRISAASFQAAGSRLDRKDWVSSRPMIRALLSSFLCA